MRIGLRGGTSEVYSYGLYRTDFILEQALVVCYNGGPGRAATPAAEAVGGEGGEGHRRCGARPDRHQYAAQQRIQRERRSVQKIQVTASHFTSHSKCEMWDAWVFLNPGCRLLIM